MESEVNTKQINRLANIRMKSLGNQVQKAKQDAATKLSLSNENLNASLVKEEEIKVASQKMINDLEIDLRSKLREIGKRTANVLEKEGGQRRKPRGRISRIPSCWKGRRPITRNGRRNRTNLHYRYKKRRQCRLKILKLKF